MDSNNCKVSIITVSYNSFNTIEQTIKSVLEQTYKNIEYIIVDGLSTDGTQQIIEKYLDSIAYFVSEKDNGLYYAMNKGIKRATGDVIGIINSDDWYASDAVENVVNYFKHNKAELTYGKTVIITENGKERLSGGRYPITDIWWRIPFMHPSVFVKKEIYERYGMFDTEYRLAADCDLLIRFYSQNVRFGYIDEVIAYFRDGGLSAKKQNESIYESYKISLKYSKMAPDTQDTIKKIEEQYAWNLFVDMVETHNGLCSLLHKYFNKGIEELIIFGTGVWGERCYKVLSNSDIKITYFVDNDSQKWNSCFYDIKIISPNELQSMETYVLIAVKDSDEGIKTQLKNMCRKGLHYVSIQDLKASFVKVESPL